jgi:hypothetical protein
MQPHIALQVSFSVRGLPAFARLSAIRRGLDLMFWLGSLTWSGSCGSSGYFGKSPVVVTVKSARLATRVALGSVSEPMVRRDSKATEQLGVILCDHLKTSDR